MAAVRNRNPGGSTECTLDRAGHRDTRSCEQLDAAILRGGIEDGEAGNATLLPRGWTQPYFDHGSDAVSRPQFDHGAATTQCFGIGLRSALSFYRSKFVLQ